MHVQLILPWLTKKIVYEIQIRTHIQDRKEKGEK